MKKYALIHFSEYKYPVLFSLKNNKKSVYEDNSKISEYLGNIIAKEIHINNIIELHKTESGIFYKSKRWDNFAKKYPIYFEERRNNDKILEFESDEDAKLWFEMECNF